MEVVREWGTPVSPLSPGAGILSVLPVVILEMICVGGVSLALFLGRGWGEVFFWAALGLIVLIGAWVILRRRNRALRDHAERVSAERPETRFYLCSDSAIGPQVEEWRDRRDSNLIGKGFILITHDGVEVWTGGGAPKAAFSFDEIVAVHDVRVWSAWIWAPQVRMTLTGDREFVAAFTFAGFRGAFGFTIADMRRLGRVLELKAPGITRRAGA